MAERTRRGAGRPTLADVAKLAGVGAITVSRALREPERVSEGLRRDIAVAVKQLGYVPNANARALASARADVIGVLIPSLTNIVFADVVRGIYDGLGASGLQVQLGNTHYSGLEEERLLRVFLSQRPAALIITGVDQTPAARRLLQSASCPVVQVMEVTRNPVDMAVGFSHFDAGQAAARHLLEAGYRRIGFAGARMDPRSMRRLEAYRATMREAGHYDPSLEIVTTAPSSVSLGSRLFRELRERAPGVDAVLTNNDDLALGVLFECQRSGIEIPAAMGIVGFHDFEMMAVSFPPMTSVRTHRHEIGRRAVEMVLDRIAGKALDTPVVDVGFELIARESTART